MVQRVSARITAQRMWSRRRNRGAAGKNGVYPTWEIAPNREHKWKAIFNHGILGYPAAKEMQIVCQMFGTVNTYGTIGMGVHDAWLLKDS